MSEDLPPRLVERIISERTEKSSNGGFSHLKDLVFAAVVLAAGATIWEQQRTIDDIRTDIAVLKLHCPDQPVRRGSSPGS
jgi:hypothetical protein